MRTRWSDEKMDAVMRSLHSAERVSGSDYPSEDEVVAYVDGSLPEPRRQDIEAMLEWSSDLRRDVGYARDAQTYLQNVVGGSGTILFAAPSFFRTVPAEIRWAAGRAASLPIEPQTLVFHEVSITVAKGGDGQIQATVVRRLEGAIPVRGATITVYRVWPAEEHARAETDAFGRAVLGFPRDFVVTAPGAFVLSLTLPAA